MIPGVRSQTSLVNTKYQAYFIVTLRIFNAFSHSYEYNPMEHEWKFVSPKYWNKYPTLDTLYILARCISAPLNFSQMHRNPSMKHVMYTSSYIINNSVIC